MVCLITISKQFLEPDMIWSWKSHQRCPLTSDDDCWHHQFVQKTSLHFRNWFLMTSTNMNIDIVGQLQMLMGVTGASFKLILHWRRNGSVVIFNHYFCSVNFRWFSKDVIYACAKATFLNNFKRKCSAQRQNFIKIPQSILTLQKKFSKLREGLMKLRSRIMKAWGIVFNLYLSNKISTMTSQL